MADNGRPSVLVLLDLSSAFDMVDHNILLARLEHTVGIKGTALDWFKSYLSDRLSSVHLATSSSSAVPVCCGVPQGSVLGPTLFSLYMLPLSVILEKYHIAFHYYADDIQIYFELNDDLAMSVSNFRECMCEVKQWLLANFLILNDKKTEIMIFGSDALRAKLHDAFGFLTSSFPDTVRNLVNYSAEIKNPEDILIFERMRNRQMDTDESCSSQAVVNYLNLTQDSHKYTLSRPVKCHNHLTWIFVEMKIFAILDVRETDQTFISYIWVYLRWDNEHIWWDPNEFCGLDHILVPTKLLWMPDLTIEEMTEKDKASPSPYLNIRNYGWVEFRNDQVVLSTCKMHVYKFPFDIQSCNLSVKSIMHSDKEILLFYQENSTLISEWSREVMHTQYEWLFINMSVTNKTVNHFGFNQTTIIYTITMKRRSVLYIANFLLPVLFFLFLDLASFLISDSGGEKLGFKITVLLAVTVMQLILNEILPCSSNKVPLIAIYCIGIFALMLLSLLETMLVMYLIEKDSTAQHNETNEDQSLTERCGEKQRKSNFQCSFRGLYV
ncbi:5-hydroxytryptamine receptor 3A-like [Maylandia zebra]|uniref:5-hydroxytryptamine receptor 3A-like n=1 Tax=Maylandia zebra TaxID=106582 RepID=UPI00403C7638